MDPIKNPEGQIEIFEQVDELTKTHAPQVGQDSCAISWPLFMQSINPFKFYSFFFFKYFVLKKEIIYDEF